MTTDTPVSTWVERPRLTRKDLAAFDKIAVDLVMEMQEWGWRGYVTVRQHLAMYHPDGSHQSLTRSSNRGSSGTAMRARFESWKRRKAERAMKDHHRDHHPEPGTFGLIAEHRSLPQEMPIALLAEVKRHPVVGPFMADTDAASGRWKLVVDDDEPKAWAVFDTTKAYPVLIGHGSAIDEARSWSMAMEMFPALFPAPGDDKQGDDMATVFTCPECGKQFDQQRKASVHQAASHNREVVECTHEGCQWSGYKNMLSRHIDATHEARLHPCPLCGREFTTMTGLSQHRTRRHAGEVPQPVTVTHRDTTVLPPSSTESSTVVDEVTSGDAMVVSHQPDVLLEHLEVLPEGSDAEAMVAAVRSVVAGPLVAEVRRLREELRLMTSERDKFRTDAADLEAKFQLMRETFNL